MFHCSVSNTCCFYCQFTIHGGAQSVGCLCCWCCCFCCCCYLAHCSYSIRRAANARPDSRRRAERHRQLTCWRDNSATDDLRHTHGRQKQVVREKDNTQICICVCMKVCVCVRLFVCLCYDGKQIEITQYTYSVVEGRKREREKEYTILLPCL